MPQYPVSITFGGPNGDVLYMVGESSAWSIQTKVRGFRLPQGRGISKSRHAVGAYLAPTRSFEASAHSDITVK